MRDMARLWAAFLTQKKADGRSVRPSLHVLQRWTLKTLARYKTPKYVFWLGDMGVPSEMP